MHKPRLLDWLFRVGDMSPGRLEALSDGAPGRLSRLPSPQEFQQKFTES